MRRALLVEDDPDIVELMTHYLTREGWAVDVERDGRAAVARVRRGGLDLVILDLQLPGLDGIEVCGEVRRDPKTRHLPLIMVTARGDETDRVVGLEMGADDYVVKPFSPRELMARVRAVLRRSQRPDDIAAPLRFGELSIDRERHTVAWGGKAAHLTTKEFALLVALVEAKGRTLTRQRLLEDVWGYSYAEGTRTIDVHVRRLREKLPGLATALTAVKGFGYRLAREEEA